MSTAASLEWGRHAPARGLPGWVYHHSELTRLEVERVLKPSWQIACHLSQIASSGDYVTFELGSDSILVLRDACGAVRAYHNVCRHRGTRLLEGTGKCMGGRITCPYHGWSYCYDGSLIATPVRESFPNLDRRKHGLNRIRVETALGFVWVCLAGNPPPPSEVWAPMLEELAPYRLDELVLTQPLYVEEWAADWKIVMDNYLESYHVPVAHQGLNRLFTPDYEDSRGSPGIGRSCGWMRETPSPRWSERVYQQHVAAVTAPHLPEPNRRSWRFYSFLPNLGIDVMPEQMDFFQLLPKGPGRTLIRGAAFGLPDDRREMRLMRWLGNRLNMQVNQEDRKLCERLQRGVVSSGYQPGPLSQIECWMVEFHDLLRERISEIKLPFPPASFA